MALEQELNDLLKQSMMSKDQATMDVVRMLKTKIMERRTAKGFTGDVDDALVGEVIAAYKKQLVKAVEEYAQVGERGVVEVARLKSEIAIVERFLPKGLDQAAVRTLVHERMAALEITDRKQIGKLLGDIMKTHKGQVDAGDIKRIVEEQLSKPQ